MLAADVAMAYTQQRFAFGGPIFITWIDFIPSKDKQLYPLLSVWWNYVSIPKLQQLHRWSLGLNKQFHPTNYNEGITYKPNYQNGALLVFTCKW